MIHKIMTGPQVLIIDSWDKTVIYRDTNKEPIVYKFSDFVDPKKPTVLGPFEIVRFKNLILGKGYILQIGYGDNTVRLNYEQ